jgi:hypothetical protein
MRRPAIDYAFASTPSHVSVRVRDSLRKKRALYTINSMIVQKFLPCRESGFYSPNGTSKSLLPAAPTHLREVS